MIDECLYNDFDRKDHLAFASKAVHGALGCDPCTGSVSFPIYQSATFKHKTFGVGTGYYYTRLENPTRQELERTMAILEGGLEAFAFTSGQAANMALFGMLKKGDHVLLSDDIYGGTFRICDTIFTPLGIEFTYVDMSELDEVRAAIRPETKMFFIETPTNPMMKVADIAELSKIAKANGALTVVDNTFMTPYFQKPIELGADIVVFATGQVSGLTSENSVYEKYLSDKRLIKAVQGHVNGKYFAGGDAVLGPKTVVEAIKSGKEAAASMIEFLEGKN